MMFIDQNVAEIWQFNGSHHGGRPPSWIFFEIPKF